MQKIEYNDGTIEEELVDTQDSKFPHRLRKTLADPNVKKVTLRRMSVADRNRRCPCKSGRMFKKCCGIEGSEETE